MNVYRGLTYKNGYLIDPFNKDEILIYGKGIPTYFLNKYDLTLPQVWNLVNGFDKDEVHYCLSCGSKLPFRKLSRGFGSFCDESCSMKYFWDHGINVNEFLKSSNSKDPSYGWNSVISKAKSSYTRFINSGNPNDICYFYIAIVDNDLYKFGITINPDYRCSAFGDMYINIHTLIKSNRLYVAKLELELKLYLGINNEHINYSRLHEVFDFIKRYLSNN